VSPAGGRHGPLPPFYVSVRVSHLSVDASIC
jgi:hypothetical protein